MGTTAGGTHGAYWSIEACGWVACDVPVETVDAVRVADVLPAQPRQAAGDAVEAGLQRSGA